MKTTTTEHWNGIPEAHGSKMTGTTITTHIPASECYTYQLRSRQSVIEEAQAETATEALEKLFPHGFRVIHEFYGVVIVESNLRTVFALTWSKTT
jgi:hypothetical protein